MVTKKQYLKDLYWNGSDIRDPLNLPYWFGHLLRDGFVKILHGQCIVVVTAKGLDFIDNLGIIDSSTQD